MRAEDARLRVYAFVSILICGFVACAAVLTSGLGIPSERNDSGGIVTNPVGDGNFNRTDDRIGNFDDGSGSKKISISMNISIVKISPACLCIGAGEIVWYSLKVTEISGAERISPKLVYLSIPGGNSTKGFHNLSLESLLTQYNADLRVGFGDMDSDGFLSVGDVVNVDEKMYNGLTFILHDEDSSPIWKDNYCMYYLYDWEA